MDNQDIINLLVSMSNAQKIRKPVEYRLYYNSLGQAISYTCEDLPGTYIIITKEQYAEAKPDVVIKNNKIVHQYSNTVVEVMVKSAQGQACSKYDVNIISIDDSNVSIWAIKQHDYSTI